MRLLAISTALVLLSGCRTRLLDGPVDSGDAAGVDADRKPLHIALVGDVGAFPENMLDALLASRATVERIAASGDGAPLDAARLSGFEVLILDQPSRHYSADEASTFAAWVSAGGGAFSMTGFVNT